MCGDLLIGTGGALKPEKCFWYLIDYECQEGKWEYSEMVDWSLMVPLPDGSSAKIAHKDVYDSVETLGVFSCPAGDDTE